MATPGFDRPILRSRITNLTPSLRQRLEETTDLLASRWGSAGPLLPGFALLAQGRPVTVTEMAAAANREVRQVEQAVGAARCARDGQGRLIDLYGLTLTPTLHRLTIDNKVLFSCCALWAHVIPKLVDRAVLVESTDPLRRELIRVRVSPAGLDSADPPGAAATLAVADRDAIDADVCGAFCCQVRHFASHESALEFARAKPDCHPVELAELQRAADRLHESIWSALA